MAVRKIVVAGALDTRKEGQKWPGKRIVVTCVAIFIFTIAFIGTTAPYVAGDDNSTGTVSFIFGVYPNVQVLHVENWSTVNGTIVPLAKATDQDGQDDINYLEFYTLNDPCYGTANETLLGNGTNITDKHWNISLDTTGLAESNYWKIKARAYDNLSIELDYEAYDYSNEYFTVNNIDQEPNWTNFKNLASTNFTAMQNASLLNDFCSVKDPTLERTDIGKISFNSTVCTDKVNFDTYVGITPGYVSVDACGLGDEIYRFIPGTITFYNLSIVDVNIIKDTVNCGGCTLVSYTHTNYTNGTLVFTVGDWDSYWGWDSVIYWVTDDLELTAWDQNDSGMPFADLTAYRNADLDFFANYTSIGGPLPNLNETNCWIRFQTGSAWTSYLSMIYNTATTFWGYTRSFTAPEKVNWSVICNSTLAGYEELSSSGQVILPNRPPERIIDHPDVTMFEDSTAQGHDLDNYFLDPDGDALNYSAYLPGSIQINIDVATSIPTYVPDPDYYGTRTSYFTAKDIYGGSVQGNDYTITVIDVPEPYIPPAPDTGGDSGGGGGVPPQYCEPTWECTDWSECKFKLPSIMEEFLEGFTGYETRVCTDLANCGYDFLKPEELRGCHYQPTCFDLIKNQGETGVDCGGPCPPCPTCFDGIRNQGETGVDCGGPCPSCPTCFDGILNQGEEDIDCGGPCPSCELVRVTSREAEDALNKWIIALMIAMVLSGVTLSVYYSRPYASRLNEWLLLQMERLTEVPVPEPTLLDLELKTLAQLQQLDERLDSGTPAELSKDYASIMRTFFEKASGLTYEFTYQELLNELRQQKVGPVTIRTLKKHFTLLTGIEFAKQSLKRPELHGELLEARKQVRAVVKSLAKTEAPTRKEIQKRAAKRRMIREQKLVLQFSRMLLQAERAIADGQMDVAKTLYNKLRGNYHQIPKKERKDMLKRIQELYKKISGGAK